MYVAKVFKPQSHYALFVVFKFHDDGLDIFALGLPLTDALFSIRVEILFLLVQKGLSFGCSFLVLNELLNFLLVLQLVLLLNKVRNLKCTLSVFLFLLLLSQSQLVITDTPELSKVLFFLLSNHLFLVLALNLNCSTAIDCCFHLSLSLLPLFENAICFVFSFCNLFVQDLISIILKSLKFGNLSVNHTLSLGLFSFKSLLFFLFPQVLESFSLFVMLLAI